jgi:hypothetical protein
VARSATRCENALAGYRIAGGECPQRAAENGHQHENCFGRGEFHVLHLADSIAVPAQTVRISLGAWRRKLAEVRIQLVGSDPLQSE